MKKIVYILMALLLVANVSCRKQEPFATAEAGDSPRILNTDIPESSGGVAPRLLSIDRTTPFNFTIVATPVQFVTVRWFIGDKQVAEGTTIDLPMEPGVYTFKVIVTTVQGKETSRTFTVGVRPVTGDPIATLGAPRMLPPGSAATINGSNMDKVAKVYLGETELTPDSVAADKVEFTVPNTMPAGNYDIYFEDAQGVRYKAVYESGQGDYSAYTIQVSTNPLISGSSFRGKPGAVVTLNGVNMEKVATLKAGEAALVITAQNATSVTFTAPSVDGTYVLSGKAEDGSAILFDGQESATLVVSSVEIVWTGSFDVTWDTAFEEIKTTMLAKLSIGTIIRAYVSGEGQGCLCTAWWTNIITGGSGDQGRGDTPIHGDTVLTATVTQDVLDRISSQDGFIIVGNGYTLTKVTIE